MMKLGCPAAEGFIPRSRGIDGGRGMFQKLLLWRVAGFVVLGMALGFGAQQDAQSPDVDEVTIPEGTEFKLQLHTTINSRTSKAGDRILTTLLDPVAVEDRD